ncbi:MAG: radical SAM protein [Erysipelotrichaceae bacterium]|nr:radical SAM protein [Erysipelotrichaceae bacterium]
MIIPIFIPHLGCPQICVFCNQHAITGFEQSVTQVQKARRVIETYLEGSQKKDRIEIAFYGGSFTALSMPLQLQYLEMGSHYIKTGRVDALRLSTRPDAIDPVHLKRLKACGVELIELGAQSFDDRVLSMSERGHSAEAIRKASGMIHEAKMALGLQLMVGLPGDTPESDEAGVMESLRLNAQTLRIYPTLVLKGTALAELFRKGVYKPLTLVEAVARVATMTDLLETENLKREESARVKLIRVGLQESENLRDPEAVLAGPHHPAFRSLVDSERFRRKMEACQEKGCWRDKNLEIHLHPSDLGSFAGHKRSNLHYLKNTYGVLNTRMVSDPGIASMQFDIRILQGKQEVTSCF